MYYRNMCHHLLLQIEDDENEAGKQTKGRQLQWQARALAETGTAPCQ